MIDETVTSVFTSSLSNIFDNTVQGINLILPIGISVFAVLFIWIFIVSFFKRAIGHKDKVIIVDSDDIDDDRDDDREDDYY